MKMPRRPRVNIEPPTSSMGDIAFLLIIFFMLTTTITEESNIDAEPPRAEHLDTLRDSPSVIVSIDAKEKIYYNGKKEDLSPESITEKVEADMQKIPDVTKRQVMFRCDKDIPRSIYEAYLGAISRAGARSVLVGTSGVPEEE